MTFNIAQFSAVINKHGGLARQNLFAVRITGVSSRISQGMPTEDLMFFCEAVELPPINILTQDYQKNAFGQTERRPSSVAFPLVPAVFLVDSGNKVMDFFHRWLQAMINFDQRLGHWSADSAGKTPFQIAYKEDYVATVEILLYSADNGKYYNYKLVNAHPVEVGSISLAWSNNDQVMVLPVVFSYDAVEFNGIDISKPDNFIDVDYFSTFKNWVAAVTGINTGTTNYRSIVNRFVT